MDRLVNAPQLPTSTTQPSTVTFSGTTSSDAFGRLRVSSPLTLFDSSHRYAENGLWATNLATGGTATFSASAGLVELAVTTTSGSTVQRETYKTFSYQPGKSLLIMSTFVMDAPQTNLTQRVGYYGADNGIYLEQAGTTINFVERSSVTGSVTETRVSKSAWNIDKLDGSGPSGYILDLTKAQILWIDLEWLGLGTVRTGFVINGELVHCHSFHHANLITSTYITTATLPLRYEIYSTGTLTSSATLKQVCSTVLSEGGYELRGLQQATGTPITASRSTLAAGAFLPIVSIRLKTSPNRLDAIVILTALSIMGDGNNNNYNWQVRATSTTTGGTWTSAGTNSSIEYNTTGTSTAGGRILASGYFSSSNQGSPSIDILKEALFSFQLERDSFTSTSYELTLMVAGASSGQPIWGSMDWEEISR